MSPKLSRSSKKIEYLKTLQKILKKESTFQERLGHLGKDSLKVAKFGIGASLGLGLGLPAAAVALGSNKLFDTKISGKISNKAKKIKSNTIVNATSSQISQKIYNSYIGLKNSIKKGEFNQLFKPTNNGIKLNPDLENILKLKSTSAFADSLYSNLKEKSKPHYNLVQIFDTTRKNKKTRKRIENIQKLLKRDKNNYDSFREIYGRSDTGAKKFLKAIMLKIPGYTYNEAFLDKYINKKTIDI